MRLILTKHTRKFIMEFIKSYPWWFFIMRWLIAGYLAFYLFKSVALFFIGL